MSRVILALVGVLLLAITALALIWVLGQLLVGVGVVVVGTAGILSRLLWFLVFTGLLSGLVYFVTSAWRPAPRPAADVQRRVAQPEPVPPTPVSPTPVSPVPAAPVPTAPVPTAPVPAPPVPVSPVEPAATPAPATPATDA